MPEGPEKKPTQLVSAWAFASGLAWELVTPAVALSLIGYWLDGRFKTEPWLTLSGAVVGISVGLFQFIRAAQQRQAGRR